MPGSRRPPTNLRELTDKQLEALYGNAVRLAQSGTQEQRAEAERILPAAGEEIERRCKARDSDRTKQGSADRAAGVATRKSKKNARKRPNQTH